MVFTGAGQFGINVINRSGRVDGDGESTNTTSNVVNVQTFLLCMLPFHFVAIVVLKVNIFLKLI
jgi:hypothetical protein